MSKVMPKLRFKEFNGEIASNDLEHVSSIRTGPFGSVLHEKDYVEIGTPIITVEHLSDQGIVHQNLPLVSDSDKERLKSYMLKQGDIVFSRVGSVDRNSIISEKEIGWLFSGRLLRIRTNQDVILSRYLSYYFQLETTKYRIRSVAVGQTMASLNTEILKSFNVKFSKEIPEQQKIASFLFSVDEKIQLLTRKKELLDQYKKGMMQQLFSGKLRFKDENGKAYPKWEENDLGKYIGLISGFAFQSELFSETGQVLMTPKNFTKTGKAHFDNRNTKRTIENVDKKYICVPGDLLVLLTDLTPSCELLGKPVFLSPENGTVLLNQRIVKVVEDKSRIHKPFLSYFFQTEKYHKRIKETSTGTTVRHSSNKTLLNTELALPSLSEQEKIANYLSAIDTKIESVANQITQTQTFKKGLLQQMFV